MILPKRWQIQSPGGDTLVPRSQIHFPRLLEPSKNLNRQAYRGSLKVMSSIQTQHAERLRFQITKTKANPPNISA